MDYPQGEDAPAERRAVVLKKLGHDAELRQLDRKICTVSGQSADHCHPGHYVKFLTESFTLHRAQGEKTLDFEEVGRYDWTEVLACMRSQRLIDLGRIFYSSLVNLDFYFSQST